MLGACLAAVAVTASAGAWPGTLAAVASASSSPPSSSGRSGRSPPAAKIAGGDRYALVPPQARGPLTELGHAIQALRASTIDADSAMVDQRRKEAEARLHYAGRSFFTRRFRGAVDEVINAFTAGSQRIGNTAGDLAVATATCM